MKKIIDTHCHLYSEEFDNDREILVTQAKEAGIGFLLLPNIDCNSINRMLEFYFQHPDFSAPMMGLHPTSVDNSYVSNLKKIESELSKRKCYCAIGEIGIDLYWDQTFRKEQIAVFEEQLQWSIDLELPVAIHVRDAFSDVFESIYKKGSDRLRGVFHSFTGTEKDLDIINEMENFKIGINGVVTFKNSKLAETLTSKCSIQKIILETDAPYLSPVPYRGKRNEPQYILKTAEKLATVFNMSKTEVIKQTTINSLEVFGREKLQISEVF